MPGEVHTPTPDGAPEFEASEHEEDIDVERSLPVSLPPELLPAPHTTTGERYGSLPTHWQNSDDKIGKVNWRTEPGVDNIDVDPGIEGTLVSGGYEFLIRRSRKDADEAWIETNKPRIKRAIESIDGVTGLHYEQLGLGLTDIESVSIVLKDEEALRQKLGSDFYDLVEQTLILTFKLQEGIMIRTEKPLSPELIRQLVSLTLEIVGVELEKQAGFITPETRTKVSKEVAARLWQEGRIGPDDIEFVHSYALTPDAKPRTARKSKDSGNEVQSDNS